MSNLQDLFGDNFDKVDRFLNNERRFGPSDDDCEVTCPYIDILPDESEEEDGSPLRFTPDNY